MTPTSRLGERESTTAGKLRDLSTGTGSRYSRLNGGLYSPAVTAKAPGAQTIARTRRQEAREAAATGRRATRCGAWRRSRGLVSHPRQPPGVVELLTA